MAIVVRASDASPEAIGEAVTRVLASEEFGSSRRMRRFLSYVVEKTLAGELDNLKEYGIATTVFDRDPSFDPTIDTIVRVEARRLRQRLAAYYSGTGRLDDVWIEIPKGGYLAVFRERSAGRPEASPVEPRAWWKRPIAYVLFAAFAGAIAAGMILERAGFTLRSRVPHAWRLDGSTLSILDARERLCWQKRFPPFDAAFPIEVADKALIADIDGDGRNEVLFNLLPQSGGKTGGSLLCFEPNGRLRWEFRYGRPRTFGTRSFDSSYRGRLLRPVTAAGKPLLLTVANHYLWYPSQAALLDPRTGALIEEYWHAGSIYDVVLHDIDGDGEDEAVFSALNNPGDGPGHAALGVLKIPFSKAPRHAFAPGDPFPPLTGGGELAYALLPMPDVSKAMGMLPVLSNFKVDGDRIIAEMPVPESGGIVYYLDFSLNIREHRFSDNFAALHHRYFVQHLLDHALTASETQVLGKTVTFGAAPDGNNPELKRFWGF